MSDAFEYGLTTATYAYGPSGMREKVTVVSDAGTRTTESVWSGMRLVLERDSDGTTYRYLYGADGLPLELVVRRADGSEAAYAYHCDRAGSVIALTAADGTVAASYAYDPWGAPCSVAGTDATLAERNPLRYRGYCYDTHSGLYYLPVRHYDPCVARFLTADPAPPVAGDPLSLNRYAYCVGDPVNASDPTGAVTDVEYESWEHYYYDGPATAGDRPAAEQATHAVVLPVARARAASAALAAQLAAARAAAAAVTYETVVVAQGDPVPSDVSRDLVCGILGGQTQLLLWGAGQLAISAVLMVAAVQVATTGAVAESLTLGLGTPIVAVGEGAAAGLAVGSAVFFVNGALCVYAGCVGNGWIGQRERQ